MASSLKSVTGFLQLKNPQWLCSPRSFAGHPPPYSPSPSAPSDLQEPSTLEITRECSNPFQRFSTATAVKPAADDTVVGVLESEIKAAEEGIQNCQISEVADGFPFEIVDNAGEQTIMLRREFDGEIIKVAVDNPSVSPIDNEDEEEDEDSH